MTRALVLASLLLAACERRSPPSTAEPAPSPPGVRAAEPAPPDTPERTADAAPPGPTCAERGAGALALIDEALAGLRACEWDVECVLVPIETRCGAACPAAVSSDGLVRARAAVAEVDAASCATFRGCPAPEPGCALLAVSCIEGSCTTRPATEPPPARPEIAIPPQNAARLTEAPPRPPAGDAEERARQLFDAVVHDDPDRALGFFFPREAFLEVKGIADAGAYWDRLFARYLEDVHTLHATTPDLDRAEYLGLDLVRRGGWVAVREEGNRLPYWASRHAFIRYRVGAEERRMEVRVLITWGERWFVIHLSEFH
jgi:hypothetical protein